MKKLSEARREIDEIDREMARLFVKRMAAATDVAAYKKENGLSVFDAGREEQVIKQNVEQIEKMALRPYYQKYITGLMDLSKRYQKAILNAGTVAYQGIPGAYSYLAMKALFPTNEEKAYESFEEVCKAVLENEAVFGILPFENSYAGEVGESMDLLFRYDLHVVDMYELKINHNLLGIKGARLGDIRRVYSKDQALAQCRRFLDSYGFELIPYRNTAAAAKMVSEKKDQTLAAIASRETAELYGLDVIAPDISTSPENTTRFAVISKQELGPGNRMSLFFTVDHKTGSLAGVMQVIARHGFNMECIRSKPLHNIPWQYYFYIELCGDISAPEAQALIAELRESCREVKLLGSYRKEPQGERK